MIRRTIRMYNRSFLLSVFLGLAMLCTCTRVRVNTYYPSPEVSQRRRDYVEEHPDLRGEVRRSILSGAVSPGMTTSEVEASWGQPSQIVIEEDAQTWSYEGLELYFENGVLEGWNSPVPAVVLTK